MTMMLHEQTLQADDLPILTGLDPRTRLAEDATGTGAFLRLAPDRGCQVWFTPLGDIAEMDRFVACYRGRQPFWMEACAGSAVDQIPADTQWLLVRRTDGKLLLLVPIFDRALRFSLDGRGGRLLAWADTGDAWQRQLEGVGVFVAVADDPYALQTAGARAILAHLGTGAHRLDKPLPDGIDDFGWCTWDAFYQDVTQEKVLEGLDRFRQGGVQPRLLILDDGWLTTREAPSGGKRLAGFAADPETFPDGLAGLTSRARQDFGIRTFLVWHAMMGYWCGVDAEALPDYGVRDVQRQVVPSFGKDLSAAFTWYDELCGVVPAEHIAAFFDDFHQYLAEQGVDGVKVDNQASIELSASGAGGRVALMEAYRRGLEASCRKHFAGRLINCMSNANEMHLMARDSQLTRTSTDFWPNVPASHGAHLFVNASVSLWFGELIHPDWDMFQSGHEMGSFHAAARAISGGPVYVSDKVGAHDFGVLRKLVASDGRILRCVDIARPLPGCIFHDPTKEALLLGLFNRNAAGWVVGLFHCYHDHPPIAGNLLPADLPGLDSSRVIVYAHQADELRPMAAADAWELTLSHGEWELFTVMPAVHPVTPIGLLDKYNSAGAISSCELAPTGCQLVVRDGGAYLFHAAQPPRQVRQDDRDLQWQLDGERLTVEVPAAGTLTLQV